jgi:hypothetical protein
MGNVVEVVTKTRKSKREVRTTEKVVPLPSSRQKKSVHASGSRHQTEAIEAQASAHQSQNTEEVHTLQLIESQEDDIQDIQVEEGHTQSNVYTSFSSYIYISDDL